MRLELRINGRSHAVEVDPVSRLLDVLREELRLTGAKEGCGQGECGACTVLLDGEPVNSCLVAVAQATGREIQTIEGLANHGILNIIQEKILEHGGTQCGICTPGIVMTAVSILKRNANIDRSQIRDLLAGNLCRCTGYQSIVNAIEAAMNDLRANT